VLWPDRFIASCSSWRDFWERAKQLQTKGEKGTVFERLTQLYLQTTPEYQTELQDVWILREVPPDLRRRLNLPSRDEGVDLIACTRHGQYWAIQSKFRSQRDRPLTRRELGTFTSLVFNTCNDIALAVVAHTFSSQQAPLDAQYDGDWPRALAISGSGGLAFNRRKAEGPKRKAGR
jgi:predicted helicase